MANRLFVLAISIFVFNFVSCDTYYVVEAEPGPQGLAGEKGDPGENGDSCTVIDNGDGTATMVCPDGSQVTFPVEGDACLPYMDYPKQGQYITSHVDGEVTAPLGVLLIEGAPTTLAGGLEVFVEDGCGSGAVIDHIHVHVANIPEIPGEPGSNSWPPVFVARVNNSELGTYEALAISGEPQNLIATIPVGRPLAPDHPSYIGVILENLPPMTAAQAKDMVLGINITFTDVDSGNQYMTGGWLLHQ